MNYIEAQQDRERRGMEGGRKEGGRREEGGREGRMEGIKEGRRRGGRREGGREGGRDPLTVLITFQWTSLHEVGESGVQPVSAATVVIYEVLLVILSVGNLPVGGQGAQGLGVLTDRWERCGRGVERGDVGGRGVLRLDETLLAVPTSRV